MRIHDPSQNDDHDHDEERERERERAESKAMARSDEAAAFFCAVYAAVQEIPHGKVTSYAHIARLVGTREFP